MGDISEMRGIIVVFGFLASFLLLLVLIPPEIYLSTYGTADVPEQANPMQFLAWNQTYNVTVPNYSSSVEFTIQGWNFLFWVQITAAPDYVELTLFTVDKWWIFYWNPQAFKWYQNGVDKSSYEFPETKEGPYLALSSLDANEPNLGYECRNVYTTTLVSFNYNQSAYTDASDAFWAGELNMGFFVDWNDRNTSLNALGLISSLLTFTIPAPFPLNYLLAAPIYGAIAYMIFIFLLRIVGSVFGGGGA